MASPHSPFLNRVIYSPALFIVRVQYCFLCNIAKLRRLKNSFGNDKDVFFPSEELFVSISDAVKTFEAKKRIKIRNFLFIY